jgi:hypothetical protein
VWKAIPVAAATAEAVPAGWYPDPAGAPQWRHWSGTQWNDDVHPFGPPVPPLTERLEAIRAHAQLVRYGVVCVFGGLGLLADVDHHQDALTARGQTSMANLLVLIALALFFFGHLAFARAAASLAPRFRLLAAVPVVNLFVWAWYAGARTSYPLPTLRRTALSRAVAVDTVRYTQGAIIIVLATYLFAPAEPLWVHAVPAACATVNLAWAVRVRDDLAR